MNIYIFFYPDFCKNLSKSEAMGELSSISSGDESESEKGFHHPFLIKDRPSSIIMNIRVSSFSFMVFFIFPSKHDTGILFVFNFRIPSNCQPKHY